MPLPAGTLLGPYEVLAQIGAGGMGEVYRAKDRKLGRLVAIKVLPRALASGDMLARFEREARAVATLNHPNIMGIYDFGYEGERAFAVMELLEGESLRQRLQGGYLPPKKAVDIGRQIAEGLAAAHAKGIIHRDIKPENLFLTRDGRVKVLDFGLAKQLPNWAGGTASELNQPTEAGTEAGTVMGTVGYMAPEQVKGQPADHRADIFSLGVVLYEMLYGRRAFQGESAVQTLHAILAEDPAENASTQLAIPPLLAHLIFRCLEKEPDNRYQSMKDLAYDLGHLSAISPGAAATPTAKARGARRLWLGVGLASALVLGTAAWAGNLLHLGRPPQPPTFVRLTHTPGTVESAFFGPDGRTIYFSERIQGGRPAIFALRPDSPEAKPVGVDDAILLGVSAGSELLLLRHPVPRFGGNPRGMLAQVSGGGGAIKEIQENVNSATWDGAGLALTTCDQNEQFRLEFAGKVLVQAHASARMITLPRLAPDGKALAVVDTDAETRTEVILYDRAGKRKVLFTKADANGDSITGLAWGPGAELWFSERLGDQTAVWGLSRSGRRRLLWRGEGSKALMDVAADGRMLLAHQQVRRGVLVRRAGAAEVQDISVGYGSQGFGVSADGQSVLIQESPNIDGGTALDVAYLQRLDGSPALRVGRGTAYSLSPDGAWTQLALTGFDPTTLDPGIQAAYRQAGLEPRTALDQAHTAPSLLFVPTGAGRPFVMALPKEVDGVSFGYLHPDGRRVITSGTIGNETFFLSLDRQGGPMRRLTRPGFGTTAINLVPLSPDGTRLIVFGGGRFFTQPLEPVEPTPIPGIVPGENPVGWSPDQKAVYVRTMGGLPLAITRIDLATGARQPVASFTPGDVSGLLFFRSVRMSTDARTIALSYVRKLSDLYLVEGLR